MFKENLIQSNLKILLSLNQNPLSLEQLAESMKTKQGKLATPLRMLQEQGLIQETDGVYQLHQASESVQGVLTLINPWMNYFDGQYYEVAKDVAEIILTKSWDQVGVKDVILFGSASRGNTNPNDLDMLILHDGYKLQEFDRDPYGERADWIRQSDMPPISGNMRYDAYGIFHKLGYKGDPADNYQTDDFTKEERLIQDSAFNNIVKRVEPFGIRPPKGWEFEDRDQFAALFDVHVLSTGLLKADAYGASRREEAVKSCRDPTFWHTVLSAGKLYDSDKHDFTMSVNDKYPGAVDLFPSK